MLADQLSANLPDFEVRKIVQLPAEWQVRGLCDVSTTLHLVRNSLMSNNDVNISAIELLAMVNISVNIW